MNRMIRKLFYTKKYAYLKKRFKKCGKNFSCIGDVYILGPQYIELGNDIGLDRGTRLEAWDSFANKRFKPRIVIGDRVGFNPDCHIGAINKIVIGNNVLFGAGVLVTDHSHGRVNGKEKDIPPAKRPLYSKGPVIIEDNVWVGERAAILPGVRIGKGAIIGANAVITHDVPPYSVVAGNPARIIKYLLETQ